MKKINLEETFIIIITCFFKIYNDVMLYYM